MTQRGDEGSHRTRAEEKRGPVPRPRSALVETAPLQANQQIDNATEQSVQIREGSRPATEALLHTQRIAEGFFDVSRAGSVRAGLGSGGGAGTPTGNSSFDRYSATIGTSPSGSRRDAFEVLAHVFEFQASSVKNQRDNAISMLASRLSRAVGRELDNLVSVGDATAVLEAFRGELLSNYTRWCGFMGINPISMESLFSGYGRKSADFAMATESALMLLIWGEAGNLRFCPEFMCFMFHKLSEMFKYVVEGNAAQTRVPKYLDEIITPAYDILAQQLADIGHGVIDHTKVRNYDDFNEIFWQEACLQLNIGTMFDGKSMKNKFQKTFVERQSWLVPIFSFWRVHTLHIVGLHLMIVGAKCQLSIEEEDEEEEDQLFGETLCDVENWLTPVITLYVCSFVRDLWDVQQSLYVFAGHRGPFGQLFLNIFRAALKAAFILCLAVTFLLDDKSFFVLTAIVFGFLAIVLEAIMLTEMWWGISSYGKWGASTERSCSGGGFAACVPARLRQLSWGFVGSICGINAVNLYTQVHSLPPITKRLRYILFWAIVLLTKVLFSYFVVLKKLTEATYTLYYADGTEYDFSVFSYDLVIVDAHNLLYIVALWLGSGLIYFLDMQIWFVIWANIAAAVEGVRRRVGEVNDSAQVVRAFSHLHKAFFSYLRRDMLRSTLHTRFAHVWNEIVDAMRDEDIISDKERQQLRYFLVNFRLPKATSDSKNARGGFAVEAEEGDWGPLFTLLPEFLMSGAVQRAVQASTEYGKSIADELREIKREEGLAGSSLRMSGGASGVPQNARRARAEYLRVKLAQRQQKFLSTTSGDQVTTEMVRQLSVTTFNLLDALCRNERLSRSLWNLHRALFASDVNQAGQGIAKATGWINSFVDEFGKKKDKPAVKVIAAFSKNIILFSVQNFPGFIGAMNDLVKALNERVSSKDWDKNVCTKLEKMVSALLALLETKAEAVPGEAQSAAFLHILLDVRKALELWKEDYAVTGRASTPGARSFKSHSKEFLRRTQVFLAAPGNSQPGRIKGAEARRRITFFVNSLFVEQPKPSRVLQMPSLTTLTPYYNEDVVLSIESLREETQDGVTVLEYLRSIYPDEFENFVERMRVQSANKSRNFPFDVDVIDPMLDVVLDTELGADLSRDAVLKKVLRAIVAAVKNKRADNGDEAIDPHEVEVAAKTIDIDDMMLQLQMWASFRGQTLSRTVRGIMYYQQAVRLLAVVENIDEFQSKETGYMFGSSDKPEDDEDDDDVDTSIAPALHGIVQNVQAARHQHQRQGSRLPHLHRRTTGQDSRATGEAESGFRLFRWGRKSGEPEQPSFRTAFTTNDPSNLEAKLNQTNQELFEDIESGDVAATRPGPPVPPRTKDHPATYPEAVSAESRPEDEKKSPNTVNKGKFKAAVARALAASRREKEMEARRGKKKRDSAIAAMNEHQGFIQVKDPALDKVCVEYGLTAELAEAKYRYVVSCQVFSKMDKSKKKADKDKAEYIKMLAKNYPGLRIAYVEEVKGHFYSVLTRHNGTEMEEEYRVRLPGQILVGEGKPNNQNHAIIFTRGEAIQAIDMNQDASLEDAIKVRQVMEEFKFAEGGTGRGRNIGRIVGFREHVFTHDVSAVANFFSLQELNFVSATQRALDNPLHVRFHYGHPDVFDRMSAITIGGISKSCKGIHLSEDIFAGFNYVLRGGEATQADYIQVSKGRDTGVSQVTGFTAKISMGNGMQARSREVSRLAAQFDIFRLLSFYYSSVGGFMNQVLLIVAVFLYVYAKLYIVFDPEFEDTVDDEVINALSSQFLFQLGFLLILPIPLLLAVEQGLQRAFSTLFNILIRLAPFFFIFSAGTNSHYVNSAIQTGQAKYQATGRGFVIEHEAFLSMFPLYLTSHFTPAFELLVALIVYGVFSSSGYFLETFSVYLLIIGLLWTPVVFNPNGLDFTYASQDFSGWLEWMNSPVDDPKKGWLSWFNKTLEEARTELPLRKKIEAIFRRSRLLILVYGFLTAVGEATDGGVDENWPGTLLVSGVFLIVVIVLMCQSWIRAQCCPAKALKYGNQISKWTRLWKLAFLVAFIVSLVTLGAIDIINTFGQIIYGLLAFVTLVYFVAQAVVLFSPDALRNIGLVQVAFYSVHMGIGLVIMLPVLMLSFFPLFVDLQTRMLFNEDFSQRFSIAKIFARQSNRRTVKKNN